MTRDEVLAVIEKAKRENATKLNLFGQGLTELPPEIGQLTSLTALYLHNNQLQTLPTEIVQLIALTELNLSENQLQNIPVEIEKLRNLQKLYLSDNKLQSIPVGIGLLSNLKELYLSNNELKFIPSEISQLRELSELYLSSNELKNIPIEIFKIGNLAILHLSNNELSNIPVEIGSLSSLIKLYLSNNKLQTIPAEICQLINLTYLNLSYNNLKLIPDEIAKLGKLKILYLTNNQLNNIPIEFSKLCNLVKLDLSNNQLQSVPLEIDQLNNLETLSLDNNQLQNIPGGIKNLKKVFLLDLRNNPCSLSDKIGMLIKQGNGVYTSPNSPQVPDELLQEESWRIYRYLEDMLIQEKRSLNEVKLILVGEGSVGKTSLVTRLVSNKFNEYEGKTEGINRKPWRLITNDEVELELYGDKKYVPKKIKSVIRVNIWDFGGQEILHATHQFFLTKRSVYILVLDARRGEQESRLEYWLKLIHSFGSDSPIIIAINKSDEHSLDLNKPFYKNKYPSIQEFCDISCKTGNGIEQLKEVITTQISNLKDVKTPLPQTWFELKGALETLDDNYINYARYEQLCNDYKITEPDSQKTLLSLLHDLGIVLNFQDDDRFDRLKETNVLNPAWVTEGVYKIINNNTLFQNKGKLSLSDLNEILDKQNYPTKKEHQFIIDMMQKFELCFPFDGDNKTYLIPELLQKSEPDLNWDNENSLAFQYHYDVLPQSVISRFIVRMNQYISKQTYWRTGVVLTYQNDSNKALIKADIEDKKIYISVTGNSTTRREFLAIIRRDFEHIHSTIKGLKVEEKIPYKTALIDYQDLINLEQMGEEYLTIPSLKEKINVKNLLAGLESERKEVTEADGATQQTTDYVEKYKGTIKLALITGAILLILLGKFYYGFGSKEIIDIIKEEVKPFFDAKNELEDGKDKKEK